VSLKGSAGRYLVRIRRKQWSWFQWES